MRIAVGVAIAFPIIYIVITHGVTKYRLGPVDDPYIEDTASWIVTLRHDLPFEGSYGQRYQVCLNDFTSERVYVHRSSSGFDAGSAYYDKDGEFMSTWSTDDTGQAYQNGEYVGNMLAEENPAKNILGDNLHFCERIPAWFFNLKVDINTSTENR